MTHFLDADGNVPKKLSTQRLTQYLGAIVAAVTTEPPAQSSRGVILSAGEGPAAREILPFIVLTPVVLKI